MRLACGVRRTIFVRGFDRSWRPSMAQHVDFASQSFFRDPAAAIARLRASGPVVATKLPLVGRVWITTTYETTAHVLKDSATFTLRKWGGALACLPCWIPNFAPTLANSIVTLDEPPHTRLRNIVDEA